MRRVNEITKDLTRPHFREIRDNIRKRQQEAFLHHNDVDAFGMCYSDADTGL